MTINTNRAKSGSATPAGRNPIVTGFQPKAAPTTGNRVRVVLQQSMRSDRKSPLQSNQGRDGQMVEQDRVLLELVGVYIDQPMMVKDENGQDTEVMVPRLYPDPQRRYPMPKVGTDEYDQLMDMPSGIWVEALYPDAWDEIDAALEAGKKGFPFTREELKDAIKNGTTNQLLRTQGGFLRSQGYIRKEEWTIGDVISGSKTVQASFFREGEADAYVKSFLELRDHHGFANVAFVVTMDDTLTVTDLGENGPSFTPSGLCFTWVERKDNFGRVEYVIDPTYTKSGALYGAPVTSARNVSELARTANRRNADGAARAVDQRRGDRQQDATIKKLIGGGILPDPTLVSNADMV